MASWVDMCVDGWGHVKSLKIKSYFNWWILATSDCAFCIPQFPFLFEFECEQPNGSSAIHKSFELPFGHSHS